MTHRERVFAAFAGQTVDRYPFWYGASDEFTDKLVKFLDAKDQEDALYSKIGIDFKTIRPTYIGKPMKIYDNGDCDTPWGIKRGGLHYGQALNHPMAGFLDVSQVNAYPFPNPDDYDVVITPQQREWAKDYCLIGGTWAPFFHDSTELMGMEEFFLNMYENPELVERIIERCFEFYHELDRRTFEQNKGVIDMYFIGNDYGSQRALLISPDMWRKFYKPYMKKLISQAKENGCLTAIHSCGAIAEVIPDLIEIGVDAINPIQVNADNMDPQMLMDKFGSKIVFFGGIDENEILLNQTTEQVRTETRRIIDILASKGKYIVAASHDYLLPEIPPQNIAVMYDEAKTYVGKR